MRGNRPWSRQAAFSGFGFLRSVSPGAVSRRGGSRYRGFCQSAPPGAAPGWETVVSQSVLYRVNQPATIVSSCRRSGHPVHTPGEPNHRVAQHAWNGIADRAYVGPAARARHVRVAWRPFALEIVAERSSMV